MEKWGTQLKCVKANVQVLSLGERERERGRERFVPPVLFLCTVMLALLHRFPLLYVNGIKMNVDVF